MEATTCRHKEHISNVESGVDEGVCSVCHQVRRYEWREGKGEKSRRVTSIVVQEKWLSSYVELRRLELVGK